MKAFQANMAKLEGADTQVLGVSIDSPFANHAFAVQNGVTFPILGDMSATAIKAYGLEKEVHIGGATMVTARRATFLIDKEGKIIEEQVDSEAVDPTIAEPNLDSQESIYAAVQARLDEGIAALQAALAGASGNCAPLEGDVIYCAAAGSRATQIQRWIRAAYTLKARFHLHLVERNGTAEYGLALAAAQNGISEAPTGPTPQAIASQAMNGQAPGDFRTFHGTTQDFDANIWGEFLSTRQDLVAGNVLIQILKTRNDPRLAAYFDANAKGQFIGSDQNNVAVPKDSVPSVINTSVRRQFTFRQPLVTWAENQLILAEAKYMTGDSVGAVLNVDAVRTAVGMPALGNVSFADVMTEKYIAMFQNIDVWSDFKRTCIPAVTPFGTATEVLGRLPYGSAERTSNPHIPLPSAYPAGTTGSSPVRNWNDPNPC